MRRIAAAGAAALLWSIEASGQTTCFGKGSVLTCLDRSGGPAFQTSCFGSTQYRTCMSQTGGFTISGTPSSESSGTLNAAFQNGAGGTISTSSGPATDPAFGKPSTVTRDPAVAPFR